MKLKTKIKSQQTNFNVYSGIGKLQFVIVLRPGNETNRLAPKLLQDLSFNHFPDAEVLKKHHDFFVKKLKENGVKVYYFFDLLCQLFDENLNLKISFIEDFLNEVDFLKKSLIPKIKTIFLLMDTKKMLLKMLQGFENNELGIKNDDHQNIFLINPLPSFFYLNDVFKLIFEHFIVFKMKDKIRSRESLFVEYLLRHELFKNNKKQFYQNFLDGSIEGGDLIILNKNLIIIGISERTRWKNSEIFIKDLFENYRNQNLKVIIIELPNFFLFNHLSNVFKQVDEDKFVIYEPLFEKFENFIVWEWENNQEKKLINLSKITFQKYLEKILQKKITFIPCGGFSRINQDREQANLGTNFLVLKKGIVFSYDCNRVTNDLLRRQKLKVIEIPSSQLKLGGEGLSNIAVVIRRCND